MSKLLLMMYAGANPQQISSVLEAHDAPGYSVVQDVTGSGSSGRHAGTRAWPGSGALLITVLPTERVDALHEALRAAGQSLPRGESLHLAVMPVESFA